MLVDMMELMGIRDFIFGAQREASGRVLPFTRWDTVLGTACGVGALFDVPISGTVTTTVEVCGTINPLCEQTTGSAATSTQTKAVFVYGAGLDWPLIPHIGLRFQYRGNVYKAANLTSAFQSTDSFTHSAEPMAGAYFRF